MGISKRQRATAFANVAAAASAAAVVAAIGSSAFAPSTAEAFAVSSPRSSTTTTRFRRPPRLSPFSSPSPPRRRSVCPVALSLSDDVRLDGGGFDDSLVGETVREVAVEGGSDPPSSETTTATTTFESLGLSPDLLRAVRDQNWIEPTPVQTLSVPAILKFESAASAGTAAGDHDEERPKKRDYASVWVEAPTGSGKTGGYALPLIQLSLLRRRDEALSLSFDDDNFETGGSVRTLVLCPTRELALQIGSVFEELSSSLSRKHRGMDVVVVTGGAPISPQVDVLAKRRRSGRGIDVLVATPGRLVDVIRSAERMDPTERALERRLLDALDATGRKDASLSLSRIEELELDKITDDDEEEGRRSDVGDMLRGVRYLVLDEADRLLGGAFKDDVDAVLDLLAPSPLTNEGKTSERRKTMLFSATFPEQIQLRVERVLGRLGGKDADGRVSPPLRLSCSNAASSAAGSVVADDGTAEEEEEELSATRKKRLSRTTQPTSVLEGPASTISLRAIRLDERDRTQALRRLIEASSPPWDRVLVFVSTRHSAFHVAKKLRRAGIRASELHGKLDQDARVRRLDEFKKGKVRVLVATDLASRGLDVEGLPVVVNYNLPRGAADFVHRIGRTGRAGREGLAISFVTASNEAHYDLIERRNFGRAGSRRAEREVLEGFEPDEEKWIVARDAAKLGGAPGARHSDRGLVHDRMHGGVKGRRKSKKDKLREKAARERLAAAGESGGDLSSVDDASGGRTPERGAVVAAAAAVPEKEEKEDLSNLTVPQLKDRLRDAGLPVSGRKTELIRRLTGVGP